MKKRWLTVLMAVLVVMGFLLISCENETLTETVSVPLNVEVSPDYKDFTLQQFINGMNGALFQNHATRSLRFFPDGGFQSFSVGLSSGLGAAGTYGSRYEIGTATVSGDEVDVIRLYNGTATTPMCTVRYVFEDFCITFPSVGAADTIQGTMSAGYLPRNVKYSYAKVPYYRP